MVVGSGCEVFPPHRGSETGCQVRPSFICCSPVVAAVGCYGVSSCRWPGWVSSRVMRTVRVQIVRYTGLLASCPRYVVPGNKVAAKLVPACSVLCCRPPVCACYAFQRSLDVPFGVESAGVRDSVSAGLLLFGSPEIHVLPGHHSCDFLPCSGHVSPQPPDALKYVC